MCVCVGVCVCVCVKIDSFAGRDAEDRHKDNETVEHYIYKILSVKT